MLSGDGAGCTTTCSCKQQRRGPVPQPGPRRRRAWGLLLGWFCGSGIVIHSARKKSPAFSPKKHQREGMLCAPRVPPSRQRAGGPLPPPWAGGWLVCLCGSRCAGDSPACARCAPVSALAWGHTWLGCLEVTGARPGVPFPPAGPSQKPPISLCPPILCWLGEPVPPLGPDASPVAAPWGTDACGSSLGGLTRGGRAGTRRFPPARPLCSQGLCSACSGALSALGAPSFGVSACPAAGPSAGVSHLLGVPAWPRCAGQGAF